MKSVALTNNKVEVGDCKHWPIKNECLEDYYRLGFDGKLHLKCNGLGES